jgi:hypothetical protein
MDSLSWVLGAGTSFVVKNLFGLYTVAFVGWTLKEFSSKEGRVISFPELGSQIAFILVLGKVIASMDDEKVNNIFLVSAACIGSLIFGISIGKSMSVNVKDASPKKKEVVDLHEKLQLKKKSGTGTNVSPSTSRTSSGNDVLETPPAAVTTTSSSSTVNNNKARKRLSLNSIPEYINKKISDQTRGQMDLTTDKARQTIFAIIGLRGVTEEMRSKYTAKKWALIRSAESSHVWISRDAKVDGVVLKDGILLKGHSFTKLGPTEVLEWLFESESLTGLDGIAQDSETQYRTIESGTKNQITVRRLVCKSTSFMRSKRDFVLVCCVSTLDDGTHIITSRSFPEDFDLTKQKRKDKKGFLRGVVYGSGFILHPWRSSDGTGSGCEISYAAHIDMMGAGHTNAQKAEPLAERVLRMMSDLKRLGKKKETGTVDYENVIYDKDFENEDSRPSIIARRKNSAVLNAESMLLGSEETDTPLPDLSGEMTPNTKARRRNSVLDPSIGKEEMRDATAAGEDALSQMKRLYARYLRGTNGEGAEPTQVHTEEDWEVFHDQDGIQIRELRQSSDALGILSASCSTKSPPHEVQKLLTDNPGAVDQLLEGRAVLSRLNPHTTIQYLAYGAIWPIGARDFLLVTSQDAYDTKTREGFVIASTSIDDICELEGIDEAGLSGTYTRSSIKIAGYVGVPNKTGGTDLTLFVDVGVCAFMPAWLLQVLAQYGLSEMMQSVQKVLEGGPAALTDKSSALFDMGKLLSQLQVGESGPVRPSQKMNNNLTVTKTIDGEEANFKDVVSLKNPNGDAGGDAGSDAGGLMSPSGPRASTTAAANNRPATPFDKYLGEFETLRDEAIKMIQIYLGILEDDIGLGFHWEEKVKNKAVTVYGTPVNGSDWNAIKGVTDMKVDMDGILNLIMNDDRTKEYDQMFDKYTFFCDVDDKTRVRLFQMSGIWPTAPREFVVLSTRKNLPDGSCLVCTRSPVNNLEIQAETKGYVRGSLNVSGYHLQPFESFQDDKRPKDLQAVGPGSCRVTLVSHVDLGGSLPSSIVNRLSTSAPVQLLNAIQSSCVKRA